MIDKRAAVMKGSGTAKYSKHAEKTLTLYSFSFAYFAYFAVYS
jgi:hypothetical protein